MRPWRSKSTAHCRPTASDSASPSPAVRHQFPISRARPVGVEFRPLLTLLVEMIGRDYNELPSPDSTRCSTLASQAAEIAELKRQLSAAHAAGSAHGAASKAVIGDLGPASALLSSPEQVCSQ